MGAMKRFLLAVCVSGAFLLGGIAVQAAGSGTATKHPLMKPAASFRSHAKPGNINSLSPRQRARLLNMVTFARTHAPREPTAKVTGWYYSNWYHDYGHFPYSSNFWPVGVNYVNDAYPSWTVTYFFLCVLTDDKGNLVRCVSMHTYVFFNADQWSGASDGTGYYGPYSY
jgi:hypothetical protein